MMIQGGFNPLKNLILKLYMFCIVSNFKTKENGEIIYTKRKSN